MEISYNKKIYYVDTTNKNAMQFARRYANNYSIKADNESLCKVLVELKNTLAEEDKEQLKDILIAVKRIK